MIYGINKGTGYVIAVTATSSDTAVAFSTTKQVKLTNAGAKACFVRFGAAAQTAVTTDFGVAAGETCVVELPQGMTHLGAICLATETTTLHVCPVTVAR